MSRKPSVTYWASRKGYYTTMQGKQHRLADGPDDAPGGPTYEAALSAFRSLLELGAVGSAKDANTVRAVLETFLVRHKDKLSARTFTHRLYGIRPFADVLGDVRVKDVTHLMIDDFVAKMRRPREVTTGKAKGKKMVKWGDAAVSNFFESVNAGFNWAVRQRLITFNPLAGLKPPPPRSRSRECVLTPEQVPLVLAAAGKYRHVVLCLEATGARPGEILAATASAWDDAGGCLTYFADSTRAADEFRHKSAAKKDRTIYFSGEALVKMRELVQTHPVGPLFRLPSGRPIGVQCLVRAFTRIRKRVGLPKLTAYSFRHTLATRWLAAGKSVDILAELLGNTPNVIRKHYSHLLCDRAAIRGQLEAFRAPPAVVGQ